MVKADMKAGKWPSTGPLYGVCGAAQHIHLRHDAVDIVFNNIEDIPANRLWAFFSRGLGSFLNILEGIIPSNKIYLQGTL